MNMANRRHSGVVGGRHAAFKTVGQIGIADFIKSGDDLLLGDICHFHFVRRGHVGIYVAASSESGFSVECGRLRWWRCCTAWHSVVGTLEPKCPRDADPAQAGSLQARLIKRIHPCVTPASR
jgi:hypothetical protein